MESFEDYGQGLKVDKGGALVRNPHGMFHLHPHYELMICTYPPTISTILCDQRVITDYPIALLVSPFVTHYAASVVDDSCSKRRTVVYFGEEVLNDCGLPVGPKELLGDGAACLYDLRGYFGRMREYAGRIEQLTDGWEARQLLGLMLHLMWSNRERRHIVMTRPDDYILKVIDYVSANLDRKLTADAIAADFFVSRDKLKKDFKRSTYTNIGDFVQEMRMNRAKELLRKKVPVNEVIRQCGYESSSYFFKRFKETTGKTPLQFWK